jgi:hypothetical protein
VCLPQVIKSFQNDAGVATIFLSNPCITLVWIKRAPEGGPESDRSVSDSSSAEEQSGFFHP